jgi:hypothetical protein
LRAKHDAAISPAVAKSQLMKARSRMLDLVIGLLN